MYIYINMYLHFYSTVASTSYWLALEANPGQKGVNRLAFVTALGEGVVPVLRGGNVRACDMILFKGSDVLL